MKHYRLICVILGAALAELLLFNHMFCLAALTSDRNVGIRNNTGNVILLEDPVWICNMVITVNDSVPDGTECSLILKKSDTEEPVTQKVTFYSGRGKTFPMCSVERIELYSDAYDVGGGFDIELNRTMPVFSISRIIAMVIVYYAGKMLFGLQSMPNYKKYVNTLEV